MALHMKLPASERVVAAYRQLDSSSQKLNAAVSELMKNISALNRSLAALNLGVSAWHTISSGTNDEDLTFWSREIGYAKVGDDWCLALKRTWGDTNIPDQEGQEIWPFEEAPRWLMIEGASKIADLLETLVQRTDEATKKVEKREKETAELVAALDALRQEDLERALARLGKEA